MDGVINTKLSGVLASGKSFTSVRCDHLGDPFALYICNSFGCPDWGKDVPEGIRVTKVNSYSLNIKARDSLLINSGTKAWQLKLEDYIHGSTLDCFQMHVDLNVLLSMIARNIVSDYLNAHLYEI